MSTNEWLADRGAQVSNSMFSSGRVVAPRPGVGRWRPRAVRLGRWLTAPSVH
ncbi:hypothetical protein I546_1709 [Mycobacterium kansasii 732]|nr:hypothetical protein I546_1709 [Mycobacterium kansasii 732]